MSFSELTERHPLPWTWDDPRFPCANGFKDGNGERIHFPATGEWLTEAANLVGKMRETCEAVIKERDEVFIECARLTKERDELQRRHDLEHTAFEDNKRLRERVAVLEVLLEQRRFELVSRIYASLVERYGLDGPHIETSIKTAEHIIAELAKRPTPAPAKPSTTDKIQHPERTPHDP